MATQEEEENFPVVNIASDAKTFATWAGKDCQQKQNGNMQHKQRTEDFGHEMM
jgi:hypothetical protein